MKNISIDGGLISLVKARILLATWHKGLGKKGGMSKKVLVIEQDSQLAGLVSAILGVRGFEVQGLESGQDGLANVKQELPALIVVGEQLSDIDGLGFIQKLRESNKKVPVTFVAKQWRDENFYRMLREDLKVTLVVHRPLRSAVFTAQLLGILSPSGEEGSAQVGRKDEVAMPTPIGSDSGVNTIANTVAGGEFARLKQRFIRSIPERLGKLEACIISCTNGSFNRSVLDNAITLAHNLKGTSLSWGFEDLGRSAQHMEAALKKAVKLEGEEQKAFFAQCAETLISMKSFGETIKKEHLSSTEIEDGDEQDLSAAKVLVVSNEPPPSTRGKTESGLALDFIHASSEEALQKAGQVILDAALIEINPQNSSLGIARQLRDLSGYENLPLGFISTPQAAEHRAAATHAGSSLFLEKPLEPEVVQKVISQLISMREGGRFRVLVVDDDMDLASLTSRCLGQFGMLTRIVNDPLLVNIALQEFTPDLILLDVNMPGMSGFEVCRNLRQIARWRDVPILFLTAQTDLISRLTAYEAGGDDYLPKPVINVELLTRVKVRLERARELKERSERDLLTGLLLRRAFSDQLNALISESLRYNFHFSVGLMDVDHFKKVNDTYGHLAGDEVLTAFGRLLRKRFRVEDLRGRWGGEEFILAFKHERKEVMKLALQRIMEELGQIDFQGEHGEVFHVTFSAGMAAYPDEADNLQDLVKVADRRLYLAKERGRKQVVIED